MLGLGASAFRFEDMPRALAHCQQARDHYNSKGIAFIDRDAQTKREYRAEMFKFSNGDPTVPCIVENGKYVQSGWGDPLRG